MTDSWVITEHDIHAMLDVLDRCEPAASDDIFYADVLIGLRELIPCADITFQLMDVAEQRVTTLTVDDEGVGRDDCVGMVDEWSTLFWRHFWDEHGCAGPVATGDHSTLLHHAQTSRTRSFRSSAIGSLWEAEGIQDEVLLPLTPLGGTDRRLLLWRDQGEPDFSERDKAMLALVRPHLAELHARRDREIRGEPNLTPRQWEVLRQVATGAGNTQIARTLGLSEATVRKHLENVFLRLGVRSRTEALARAQAFLDAA